MSEIQNKTNDESVPSDLISFLKAFPDGRFLRGVRYPQWFLLLVAVLGILSGCRISRDPERFARRHREVLNQALRLEYQALAIGCQLSLPVQQGSPTGVWPGAAGLDDQPDSWWRRAFGPAGL